MSSDKVQKARELVLTYLATHSLSEKLNCAVNELCRSRPNDPWLFLTDLISEWSKQTPIIDQLIAKHCINQTGNPSLQLSLYGKVSNTRPSHLLCSQNIFQKISNFNENEEQKVNKIISEKEMLIENISLEISDNLRSIHIHEQQKIDQKLRALFYTNVQYPTFNIIPSISTLMAISAAQYMRKPLYEYLDETFNISINDDNHFSLPNIMMQLTHNSSLPSISIMIDNKIPAQKRITIVTEIANDLLSITKSKIDVNTNAIIINDCQSLTDLLSMCNQAIDKCFQKRKTENTKNVEKLEITKKDITFCLTMTNKYLNYNKLTKTYNIENKEYNNTSIIEYYTDLLSIHPMIKYLEDPLFNDLDESLNAYKQLTQSLDSNVQIIGNKLYACSMENVSMGMEQQWTDGVFVCTQHMLTLSNVCSIANSVYDDESVDGFFICISDHLNDNCLSHYTIDLAVAVRAEFIRLALPNTGVCTHKYNRWLNISQDLVALKMKNTEVESIVPMDIYYGENIHNVPYGESGQFDGLIIEDEVNGDGNVAQDNLLP